MPSFGRARKLLTALARLSLNSMAIVWSRNPTNTGTTSTGEPKPRTVGADSVSKSPSPKGVKVALLIDIAPGEVVALPAGGSVMLAFSEIERKWVPQWGASANLSREGP